MFLFSFLQKHYIRFLFHSRTIVLIVRKPHFLLNRFGTKSGVTFSEELRRRQAGFCLFKRGSSFTEKLEVLFSASMYFSWKFYLLHSQNWFWIRKKYLSTYEVDNLLIVQILLHLSAVKCNKQQKISRKIIVRSGYFLHCKNSDNRMDKIRHLFSFLVLWSKR